MKVIEELERLYDLKSERAEKHMELKNYASVAKLTKQMNEIASVIQMCTFTD